MLDKLTNLTTTLLANQPVRYIIAGGINTVLTLLLYWGLERFMWYQYANAIAYLAGIVLAYYLNTLFVFRTPTSFRTFMQFPLVYVVQYAASALLLGLLVERIGVDATIAPLIIVVALLPLTYALSKLTLRVPSAQNRRTAAPEPQHRSTAEPQNQELPAQNHRTAEPEPQNRRTAEPQNQER